jgi:hypothetical protein
VMPLEHGVGLLPGHRRLSEGDSESVNHVPGQVLTMSLYCTDMLANSALLLTAPSRSAAYCSLRSLAASC